jgi:hypothetical protein
MGMELIKGSGNCIATLAQGWRIDSKLMRNIPAGIHSILVRERYWGRILH